MADSSAEKKIVAQGIDKSFPSDKGSLPVLDRISVVDLSGYLADRVQRRVTERQRAAVAAAALEA